MQKTMVWQILERLPSSALLEIEKITRSPFFNSRDDVIALFKGLRRHLKRHKAPARENLYAEIWPDSPYNGAGFRLTLHFLQELILRYLSNRKMEENKGQQSLLLAKAINDLSLPHLAQNILQDAEDYFLQPDQLDPEFQEQKFQFLVESLHTNSAGARTRNLNLQALSTQVDKAYLVRKLKTSSELLSHQSVYNVSYEYGMLDWLFTYIEQHLELLDSPEVNLYYNCCLSLRHPENAVYFQNMKPLLLRTPDFFPAAECRDVVLLALNFCIRRLNAGDEKYAREGFDLYADALEKGYLLEQGEIDRFTFRNVVALGLMIQSYDWVEKFIDTHAEKIATPYRESMVSFNRARLEYSRKNYARAIQLLQKADYDDLLLNLAAKTILMKIYFEAKEFRLLDSHLDSMAIFLRRKKIIGYHKQNYTNIVKYGHRLCSINPFSAEAIEELRKAINAETHLTERSWFLQQLAGLR